MEAGFTNPLYILTICVKANVALITYLDTSCTEIQFLESNMVMM